MNHEDTRRKLKNTFEDIFDRYEDDPFQGDIVDLESGRIIEDRGHLRSLPQASVWGDATSDEEDQGNQEDGHELGHDVLSSAQKDFRWINFESPELDENNAYAVAQRPRRAGRNDSMEYKRSGLGKSVRSSRKHASKKKKRMSLGGTIDVRQSTSISPRTNHKSQASHSGSGKKGRKITESETFLVRSAVPHQRDVDDIDDIDELQVLDNAATLSSPLVRKQKGTTHIASTTEPFTNSSITRSATPSEAAHAEGESGVYDHGVQRSTQIPCNGNHDFSDGSQSVHGSDAIIIEDDSPTERHRPFNFHHSEKIDRA